MDDPISALTPTVSNLSLCTVDHQFNVKIADLELGFMTGQGDGGLSSYDVSWRDPYAEPGPEQPLIDPVPDRERPLLSPGEVAADSPDNIDVNELLANWLAPEVSSCYFNGRRVLGL
jgi:hypothetical protein